MPSSPVKLPVRTVLSLLDALNSLDGSKGEEKDTICPFEFDPKVAWNLAKNATILEREKVAFEKTLRTLARQNGIQPGERLGAEDKVSDEKAARWSRFNEVVEDAKNADTEVRGLLPVKLHDLLRRPLNGSRSEGRNPIPQSVLNRLVPIIDESP